ncbi:LA2681 family HEPN domain-containing protein [Pseudomonas mosselii]|uniref:LA2681 family HEPN domain-containing protein n=1 Tax=Pseudomonas mosselii TaxID=78327 RepID=UPI002447F400|nr:LA2681 family HEPN domain-containing protein [Pseudomonas mosselii]MDH1100757.1 LA2681 family HEPN domain-containing protein [Pseudomonas mosselii]
MLEGDDIGLDAKKLGESELNSYAEKMDSLIANGNIIRLKEFLVKIEPYVFLNSQLQSNFYYILGTGYSKVAENFAERWIDEWAGKSVKYFRKAMYEEGFVKLTEEMISRIYANYGFALGMLGRSLESISELSRAIKLNGCPEAMLGKGMALLKLATEVTEENEIYHFQHEAYRLLSHAYKNRLELFEQDTISIMERDSYVIGFLQWWDSKPQEDDYEDPPAKGRSKLERRYKRWCAEENLYIDSLSDAIGAKAGMEDFLCFPDYMYEYNPLISSAQSLTFSAAFSEIKHQFAFARFNYFDAISCREASLEKTHFSDEKLHLTNSLDYCIYRRDIEMMKVSFRLLYSCFDKIAMLLNKYLMLEFKSNKIDFRKIWYANIDKKQHREFFLHSKNGFFLALYWLSRDINDSEETGHGYWLDENAEKLADIRNKMEHQGFRVVIDDLYKITSSFDDHQESAKRKIFHERDLLRQQTLPPEDQNLEASSSLNKLDRFIKESDFLKGYPLIITDREMRSQTMRLMRLVRYAIIYTALGIHHEEKKKNRDGLIFSSEVPAY